MSTGSLNLSVNLLETYLGARGYTFEKLTLNNVKFTRFQPSTGKPWLVRNSNVAYPFLSSSCQHISKRKDLSHAFCEQLGVTTPKTFMVKGHLETDVLHEYLQDAPLVVKPLDSAMSNGVTLGITEMESLKKAINDARAYSATVLVQKQLMGEEIRFVVVDGQVEGALLRQTPRLVGDGQSTISELLNKENANRKTLHMPYLNYPILEVDLISSGKIDTDYVPTVNEVVELGKGTMIKTGASVYDVHEQVHISYKEVAERLATALDARFIVVDMMIDDYLVPMTKDNYAFLEFNTAPALKLFYSCRDGKHFDALGHLAPIITESLQGV